jgi:hypothetical protein
MNKYLTILLIILACACSTPVGQNDASISFDNVKHDFAKIPYKKEANCSFGFSNPGKTMLIIYEVKTSCGCTVPEWTKEPIRPGKNGTIAINYKADFPGVFHKTVTVFYNGINSPDTLEIHGEVEYPENDQL